MSFNSFFKLRATILGIALLGITLAAPTQAADKQPAIDAGLKLARAVYDRPTGKDSSARVEMLLLDKNGTEKSRVLFNYGKDNGDKGRAALLRFVEPANVDGTGLLTFDYRGDESDQWLYLPALKKVRRIASSRKGGRFVGSDFYYEDLMDREPEMDKHRIIGQDKVGGLGCTLLESIPVKASNSVYAKRISCIYTRLSIPLRIDFYEKRGKEPVKRLQARKIKKIQGYWTIFDSTMQNLKTGDSTQLLTTDIIYDQDIPDELFSQRGLADTTREIPYRPVTGE